MARPMAGRGKQMTMYVDPLPPQKMVRTVPYALPVGGMNTALRLSKIPPTHARLVRNMSIRDEVYKTRDGTHNIGDTAAGDLLFARGLYLSDGTRKHVRLHLDGVDIYDGHQWSAATGPTIAPLDGDTIAELQWGDTWLFAFGRDGIYELDVLAGTYSLIANSPEDVIHLEAFGLRVVASLASNAIAWSVRASSLDWTGIGSGDETLRSSGDVQTAVIRVTDDTAIMVRTNSIWLMRTTGDFDAPFGFSLLQSDVGGEYPTACCRVPGGAALVSRDSVVLASTSGIEDVGLPIRRTAFRSNVLKRVMYLVYNPTERELYLSLPTGSATAHIGLHGWPLSSDGLCYRMDMGSKRWTEDAYPFPIRSLAIADHYEALQIDELSGQINALSGVIDLLGVDDGPEVIVMTQMGHAPATGLDPFPRGDLYVVHTHPDALTDIRITGSTVNKFIEYRTGYIVPGTVLDACTVSHVIVEYECSGAVTLNVIYSLDGGTTWTAYASIALTTTSGPTLAEAYGVVTGPHVMFGFWSADAKDLRILGLMVKVQTMEEIENAR